MIGVSATSVGKIGLDLVVNSSGFNRQMSGISGIAKKAGVALAAAFSVKAIINFSKECIKLGSDLDEVQNVVDVTFPSMTAQVDKFAKSAATSFGLSETMAKKYTGTYGAMSKAFGFTEKQAYLMSTTLTGLAGDVASFYNISQDEAYTKLKSVFSGETETLKDLGVVMTQSALDAYALANGFGKTTSAMSEAEKVALRYKFVQEKLSAANGDFARTSDSWANQVRLLRLQVESIMATIGQGLINLLTPVIKVINTVISKIATLANAFKSLTEMITGKKSSPGKGLEKTTAAAEGLGNATEGIGTAAKKAAKELRQLAGFDRLNNIQTSSSGDSGSDGGGASDFDFGEIADDAAEAEKKLSPFMQGLIDRMKELADLFKKGFKAGLGEDFEASLQRTKEHLQGIRDSLIDIFTDPRVQKAANDCADKIAYAAGQIAGSFVSIGQTIIENLAGGIDKYLDQNKDYIKDRLVGIFDATGDIAEIAGNFAQSFAEIFEVFRGDTAKQCTADIIGIFSNSFLGVLEFAERLGGDILDCICQPIIDNKDLIKETIEGALQPISEALSTINTGIRDAFSELFSVYDSKIRPTFEEIRDGLSEILKIALDNYNQYIAPVFAELGTKFQSMWSEHIQPILSKAVQEFGKLGEWIGELWKNVIQPFVSWIIQTLAPVVGPLIKNLGSIVLDMIGHISDIFSGFWDLLSGFSDFFSGIFSGNWEKTCQGLGEIASGTWTMIGSAFSATLDFLNFGIQSLVGSVQAKFALISSAISTKMDAAKDAVKNSVEKIKSFFKFEWKLPKLKLPHFEVSGDFSLNPPSVPSFGVNWYAKGGIINSPTLAMMGENGKKEAVVPLERNLQWRDAIADKIMERMGGNAYTAVQAGGITAEEMKAIMLEMITIFAQLIGQLDVRATIDSSTVYKAVKTENEIAKKSTGKGL